MAGKGYVPKRSETITHTEEWYVKPDKVVKADGSIRENTYTVYARVNGHLMRQLDAEAIRKDQSRAEVVTLAIHEYLKRRSFGLIDSVRNGVGTGSLGVLVDYGGGAVREMTEEAIVEDFENDGVEEPEDAWSR